MRSQSATITITRAVTVAAGVFAPGHLGELTQYLPFELVDDILAQTKTVQRRLRDLPSRVVVYFVLALGMYPRLGYGRVRAKLTAGLGGLPVACPSEKALRDLRRRLGPAPLKALFEVVAGPLAQPPTRGVRFGGLRTVAFDGCNSLKAPDTGRNRWWLGRIRYRMGFAGYPTLRLMALAETGTRGLLGAALGSAADRDEATVARRLLPLLHPGMLVLLDRAFDANAFLRQVAATGALLLARAKSTRHPAVLAHLPDGSYLSDLGGPGPPPGRVVSCPLGRVEVEGADRDQVGFRGSYATVYAYLAPFRGKAAPPAAADGRAAAAGIPAAPGPGGADVSAPAWLGGSFAALMIVIAVCCAGRLAISRLRGGNTERDADALHVLMGVAMAGMLEPRLTAVPVTAWRAVFAAAAAWFAWQAIRPGRRARVARCAHPAAHAVESAVMVYRLLPVGSWPSGHGPGMAMPGMSQGTTAGNPALTLVLALFMLGYVLWAIDRLARLSRSPVPATARVAIADRPPQAAQIVPVVPGAAASPATARPRPAGGPVLIPRFAASYTIAMAITMGYMLITML